MKKYKKLLLKSGLAALFLGVYPLFVLLYTWGCVFRSELDGGRHGPLDAYRHALASAVVSYTLDERAVRLVTWLMESGNKESNKMDRHNNLVGARIGANATSFSELEPAVKKRVLDGMAHAEEADRITWLPQKQWRDGRIW